MDDSACVLTTCLFQTNISGRREGRKEGRTDSEGKREGGRNESIPQPILRKQPVGLFHPGSVRV